MTKQKLEVGTVLLFSYNNAFSKIIQWFNAFRGKPCKWTHVAIVTEVHKDTVLLHEAIARYGKVISSEYGSQTIYTWIKDGVCYPLETRLPLYDVKHYADAYIGKPYGFRALYTIALSLFYPKSPATWSDGLKSLICSEAIARILYDASDKRIDFVKEFGKSYDLIEPRDIFNSVQLTTWQDAKNV